MRHGPKRFCSFLPFVTSRRSVSKTQKMPAAESPASLRAVPSRQSVSYDVFVPCIPYDSHYQICYSTMPPRTVWELDAVGGQLIRQPASSHVLVGDATPLASSQPSNCASDPRQASVGAPFLSSATHGAVISCPGSQQGITDILMRCYRCAVPTSTNGGYLWILKSTGCDLVPSISPRSPSVMRMCCNVTGMVPPEVPSIERVAEKKIHQIRLHQ